MKLFIKLSTACALAVSCLFLAVVPAKADNLTPSQILFLQQQMEIQKAENAKALEYFKLQEARAKGEKRPISDIEMVKRQALEGMITGNNQLLVMGDRALNLADPLGAGNIALMDQAAYNGYVSGMAALEEVKQKTWMQYTFRTH